ncbi:MAG TPA: hypothetical protein VNX68_12935 [Nitrosopumilaceae archaeon]|nr:hypothetical protein [Nitrosopumilaceae archaeon]
MFEQKNDYNTLFIGSSRAECHFNPRIFDSITGLNSFNIGISGSNNAFTYGILKSYLLKSTPPSVIIMNIDFHYSNESSDTIYNFPRYFPYLDHPVLYQELQKRDKRFFWFKYFPFYSLAFTGDKYINASLRGYFNVKSPYDESSFKGNQRIIPLQYKNLDSIPATKYKGVILPENLNYLDSIISLSRKIGSQLYFVISPSYFKGTDRIINIRDHIQRFIDLGEKKHIQVWNYTNDSLCTKKELFADFYHMKSEGCDLFTIQFSNDFLNNKRRNQ